MANHDVIVIGASAGASVRLQKVVARLPRECRAALHLPDADRSGLSQILSRAGSIPAVHAENGLPIEWDVSISRLLAFTRSSSEGARV